MLTQSTEIRGFTSNMLRKRGESIRLEIQDYPFTNLCCQIWLDKREYRTRADPAR